MKRLPKILLTLCVAFLGVGLYVSVSSSQFAPVWTVLLPLGAIFYGLCLITTLLQNETPKFDEEERLKRESIEHPQTDSVGGGGKTVESSAPDAHDLEPRHAH